jgi:tRNA threonylcarbamoyladenosine biosynthesis protein TsaE
MEKRYTEQETGSIAELIFDLLNPSVDSATVLALQGELGAGKTTLVKALAEKFGVQETVISPTFVIAKFYPLRQAQGRNPQGFENIVHVDAYRIESLDELQPLGWSQLLKQSNTLIIVEWPERIIGALPNTTQHFLITHEGESRTIKQIK